MKKLIKSNVFRIEQYEPGKPIELLRRELGLCGEVCKLASNENPLGVSPVALDAVEKALAEGNIYPDNSCYELRDKLGQILGFSMDNLRIGNGSSELIYQAGIAMLEKEDNIVTSEYAFIMAKLITQIMDCEVKEVPLDAYHHDLDGILAAIDENTKIVYLDMPMNPIGTGLMPERFSRFVDKLPEDVLLICDEAYHGYAGRMRSPETLHLVREGRNVLVLRTFSKLYGLAGFRVGFGVAGKRMVEALRRVSLPFAVNKFAQIAAIAALDDEDHVAKTLEMTAAGKKYLYERFDEMSVFYIPSETNFVTIDLKKDVRKTCSALQKEGVIVRPLIVYEKPTFLRITIGTMEQNRRFVEALKKIHRTGSGG